MGGGGRGRGWKGHKNGGQLGEGGVSLSLLRGVHILTPTEYTQNGNGRLSCIPSIMMEKLAQAGVGGKVDAHPLSLYLPSRTKLQCTLELRGQIHSSYFISIHMYFVLAPTTDVINCINPL